MTHIKTTVAAMRSFNSDALPLLLAMILPAITAAAPPGKTQVSIVGEDFHINGQPTYAGRSWKGHRIEGLLLNSRMVQATFDDLNPETAKRWAYPDTGQWDAERNVRESIAAMPEYHESWRRRWWMAHYRGRRWPSWDRRKWACATRCARSRAWSGASR